jgi:LysR family transcriptional regulator, glycine cleavage system transcriptional activator
MKLNDLPLGFLPAFAAAGRLGSFAAAAAELHVTPSAISQQIRALEDSLGVALFERGGRSAALTSDGRAYLHEVCRCLTELASSTARVRRRTEGTVLRLSTVSLAAHEFLLPRLPDFRARFPSIELRIESSNELIDFRVSECDAAIRVGTGWPELNVRAFGRLSTAFVCSPELARNIHEPSDLAKHTLLDPCGGAQRVLAALMEACGLPLQLSNVWTFETCHEALRAAEHGLGVTFAAFPIATHWVSSGRLAVPLPHRMTVPGSICLAYRGLDESRFPFTQIGTWLEDQYAALEELADGRIVSGELGLVDAEPIWIPARASERMRSSAG